MMKIKKTPVKLLAHTGGALADVLAADGLLDESEAVAIKRVLAWQLEKSMKPQPSHRR